MSLSQRRLSKKQLFPFETTYALCEQLPLGVKRAHGAKGKDHKFPVQFFAYMDRYYKAGGTQGSISYYTGSTKQFVLAPLKTVGVELSGKRYIAKSSKDLGACSYSLAMQLTDASFRREEVKIWLRKGFCAYVKHLPYKDGEFSLNDAPRAVSTAVVKGTDRRGGYYNLGKEVYFPKLEKYLKNESKFSTTSPTVVGLLIFTYFAHLDGDGDGANLRKMMKLTREECTQDDILNALLAGRTWDDLEDQLADAWRKEGIKLIFTL